MKKIYILICLLLMPSFVLAHGIGTISSLLVGRLGYQVMVNISGSVDPVECRTRTDWQYYLDLTTPGAKEMLATLLTAKSTGQKIYVVSTGTCDSTGQGAEVISYLMLL